MSLLTHPPGVDHGGRNTVTATGKVNIMSRHKSEKQTWGDDPAGAVVDELYADISRELGTDGPEETFGHPDESQVGHLVEDDHGMGPHDDHNYIASDSHDVIGLSAEEQAMHVMTDEELEAELDEDEPVEM